MHEYYQPTETEQMYIAAGIIKPEQLDAEYQEYLQNTKGDDHQMSYNHWNSTRQRLDRLGEAYKREIEPLYRKDDTSFTWEQREREKELLNSMSRLEIQLGY